MSNQAVKPRVIRLYGHLGKRFGRVHRFAVASPAEAVRALCANFKDFKGYVNERSEPGYRIITDRGAADIDHIHDPSGDIKIIPVVAGAKKGIFGIVLGAALIAAAFYMPGMSGVAFQIGGQATTWGQLVFGVGANLLLGGVAQMLSPTPKTPGLPDRPENKPSFGFDGAVNTAAQGNAVPVGYGRLIVGSVVVSSGLSVEQIA